MSKERVRTVPDLTVSSSAHQEARVLGSDHFSLWERNVIDHFKNKSTEEIKSELQATAYPFAVCFEHWIGDFNLGTGIRNANAFNAKEVFYIGDKKWDRRSSMGVHNYTQVQWLSTIDDLVLLRARYTLVGVDNVPGSIPIDDYQWTVPCCMVFGEEGVGLTMAMQSMCQDLVHIPMFGSVRSFNCGTASGIAMYDFVCKYRKQHPTVSCPANV